MRHVIVRYCCMLFVVVSRVVKLLLSLRRADGYYATSASEPF